ncbi:hypothetical protein [Bosea sp. LC85]|uniref:hypothetical protein n=1 Tax=Bosea sp. LC85 TaxID=1502851 RepID=UPI001269C888|nr:hypothetical protein [Bosea sp. LC85]
MANILCRAGIAGLLVSGCLPQSVPTVEAITKPTIETFARLGGWRPWQSAQAEKQQAAPAVPPADPALEPSRPVLLEREQVKVMRPALKPTPVVATVPKPVAPPAPRSAPVAMREEPTKSLPALVSCRTHNEPGQRVRMECNPVE